MLLDKIFIKGIESSVYHSGTLYNLPIVPTLLKDAASLIETGNAFPTIFLKNNQDIIWIENNEDVISFIVFDKMVDEKPICHIHFSWVNSKHRGNGIRSIIQNYLETFCIKNNIFVISTQTFVKNKEIDKSYEKIGLNPVTYMRYKKLK